ncbi:hypothetical protein SAMD00019534_046210 [Acytostelium subglobosum LB1]|uniref:hypothetical protein n=1 Tax=Acytostelium subglobosum LB1 TaxID=1410327 RepID=UPI000644BF3F|nr:hypothetical protein SAMD00019534_046210 [Acytostelium subglobosum LB1]GAM21446.1 hypothetical protein SAMD00019534_046210 [Acytostelium subglobosum LB1]|eukprot:XP_012755565.1 hypothetical protein SAMD00019534_046210 [Acytostelium subglobosum LB1]
MEDRQYLLSHPLPELERIEPNVVHWSDAHLNELRSIYSNSAQSLVKKFEQEVARPEWTYHTDKKEISMCVRPSSTAGSHYSLSTTTIHCPPTVCNSYINDWECRNQYDKFFGDAVTLHHFLTHDASLAAKYNIPYSKQYDCMLQTVTTSKRLWLKPREFIVLSLSGPHPSRPRAMITVGTTIAFSGAPPTNECIRATCDLMAWLFEPINDGRTSKLTHILNFEFGRDSNSLTETLMIPLFPKMPVTNCFTKLTYIRSKLNELFRSYPDPDVAVLHISKSSGNLGASSSSSNNLGISTNQLAPSTSSSKKNTSPSTSAGSLSHSHSYEISSPTNNHLSPSSSSNLLSLASSTTSTSSSSSGSSLAPLLSSNSHSPHYKTPSSKKKHYILTNNFTMHPNDWAQSILNYEKESLWMPVIIGNNKNLDRSVTVLYKRVKGTRSGKKVRKLMIKTMFEVPHPVERMNELMLEKDLTHFHWDPFAHTIKVADKGAIVSGGGHTVTKKLRLNHHIPSYKVQCLHYHGYVGNRSYSIEERDNGDVVLLTMSKSPSDPKAERTLVEWYFFIFSENWVDKVEPSADFFVTQVQRSIGSFYGASSNSTGGVSSSGSSSSSNSIIKSQHNNHISNNNNNNNLRNNNSNNSNNNNLRNHTSDTMKIIDIFIDVVNIIYPKFSTEQTIDVLKLLTIETSQQQIKLAPIVNNTTPTATNSTSTSPTSTFTSTTTTTTNNKRELQHDDEITDSYSMGSDDNYDSSVSVQRSKRSKEHHYHNHHLATSIDMHLDSSSTFSSSSYSSTMHNSIDILLPHFIPTTNKPIFSNNFQSTLAAPPAVTPSTPPTSSAGSSTSTISPPQPLPTSPMQSDFPSAAAATQTKSSMHSILLMPGEILNHIFSYFGDEDLCRCSRTCHVFKRISEGDALWYCQYVRRFGKCCFKKNPLDTLLPPNPAMWDIYRKTTFPSEVLEPPFKDPRLIYFLSKETQYESIEQSWKKKFFYKIRMEALWCLCTGEQPLNTGGDFAPSSEDEAFTLMSICSYKISPSLYAIIPNSKDESISAILLNHNNAFFATNTGDYYKVNLLEVMENYDNLFTKLDVRGVIKSQPAALSPPLSLDASIDSNTDTAMTSTVSSHDTSDDDSNSADNNTPHTVAMWLNQQNDLHSVMSNRVLYSYNLDTSLDKGSVTLGNSRVPSTWDITGAWQNYQGDHLAVHYNSHSDDSINDDFDTILDIFNVETGRLVTTLDKREQITCASYNCNRVAVGGQSGPIDLFDCYTGNSVISLLGHNDHVLACRLLDDENCVVSAGVDNTVKFYDERAGPYYLKRLQSQYPVKTFDVTPTRLICATSTKISYWDPRNLQRPIGELWSPLTTDVVNIQLSQFNVMVLYSNGISHCWDFR